jgi:hypothetical protein
MKNPAPAGQRGRGQSGVSAFASRLKASLSSASCIGVIEAGFQSGRQARPAVGGTAVNVKTGCVSFRKGLGGVEQSPS